ncbi:MAG: hypothetical protein ABIV94_01430 [Acidimicrobiales bacterium]
MPQLLSLIRSLGNDRAIANAKALLDERRAEAAAMRALDLRIGSLTGTATRAA